MSQRMKLFLLILIINGLLVLPGLESHHKKKRKDSKHLDEGRRDASLSGGGAALCLSLLLAL